MTPHPGYILVHNDRLFTLSTGQESADITVLGSLAAEVVVEAVVRAVKQARGLGGIPSARDLKRAGQEPKEA
ncbi:MAG: hypothetical protein AAB270_00780 [Chloroflexota bacterium]